MAAASKFNSVVTNPGGTGTTITPTLSTHAAGDVIEIFVSKTGNAGWSAPAGWTIRHQTISPGTASTATVGTLLYRRVLPGDSLPLPSPVCNLGATVTRHAIARTIRGADVEGVYTLPEWGATGTTSGTNNPIRPPSVTTPAPEMFVTHYYCQRVATNAPEPTGYTQDQQVITSGTLVTNISEKTVADQQTVLSNQDASPTSGGRWVGMITCVPSPDYPYYRSGSQAFNSNATSVTPALPTGTTASDNRGNKDLIIATVECAGTPTIAPNTPSDWTPLPDWSNTTSGGGTTVRKYWTLYDGSLDRQFTRSTSGEIFVYFSCYHNANQLIPTGTSAVQQNASSTTSTFPALNRTGTKATVQATCIADATPTFTAPSGWTERNDSQGVTCADQSFNATGSTASASFTLNSASPTLCGLMEVFSVASVINLTLTPASVSLTLTEFAPTIDVDITITPNTASLTLTTFAPSTITGIPFPATVALDTFNRANESPLDNGTWGGQLFAGDGNIALVSNQAKGAGASSGNNHGWLTQYGPDCEVYVEIINISGEDSIQVFARLSQIGGSFDGYSVRARGGTTNNLLVFRWDNGSLTTIATLPQTVSNGDWFGIRLTGSLIEIFYKDVSVSSDWFLLGDVTDANYNAAGHLGLYLLNNANIVDNFSGGTIGATVVTPATASLTLTSFAPVLRLVVTPAVAALTLTTNAPSVTETVTVPNASLSLTTFAPTVDVTADVTATPAPASLTLTTFAVQVREVVTPASQSLVLTTFAAKLVEVITPGSASLSLTTFAPVVSTNTILTPASGSLTLTTNAPQLREVVSPNAASLSLTSFAPTVTATANITVMPSSVTLTTTGFVPELREQITPNSTTLTLTAFAPDVDISADITVTPSAQLLTLTGFAPALRVVITPASTTLSLSTFETTITISADRVETPTPASLTLTTFAPELRLVVTPTNATLNLSASAPSLVLVVQPAAASLNLLTFAPTVQISAGVTVVPDPASLTLTLFAPTTTTSVITTPPRRTYVVESHNRTVVIERELRVFKVAEEDREEVLV